MSEESTRIFRSSRIKRDYRQIRKQLEIAKVSNMDTKLCGIHEHELVKRKVMNCGDPHCWLCTNPRKIYNGKKKDELTLKEQAVQHVLKEELLEIGEYDENT